MESSEHRLIKLELRVDGHAEELAELQKASKDLSESLEGIKQTLLQIKWLVMGGAVVFAVNELGITKVVKILLGGLG